MSLARSQAYIIKIQKSIIFLNYCKKYKNKTYKDNSTYDNIKENTQE